MQVQTLLASVVAALETRKGLAGFNPTELAASWVAARNLRAAIVAEFQRRWAEKSADEVRTLVLPLIGKIYNVPIVTSESNRNKGQMTLDRSAPHFETAKTALRDMVADIVQSGKGSGSKSNRAEAVEVPAHIAKLAAALAAACNEYEGAKRLAAQAVAEAFAAK